MKEKYGNIICVKNLSIRSDAGSIVKDINFCIKENRITALIGQSGSGKSLIALSIMRLIRYIEGLKLEGNISFKGVVGNILELEEDRLKNYRGNMISMIFQDPYMSFDPLKKCGAQLLEILNSNGVNVDRTPKEYLLDLFLELGVEQRLFDAYPHMLSGGELQRLSIIASVIPKPKVIIADEPTTNLDAGLKKDVLALLSKIRKDFGITILYISHDLEAVRFIADDIIRLEKGKIIEQMSKVEFFKKYDAVFSSQSFAPTEKSISGDDIAKTKVLEVKMVNKTFSNNNLFSFAKPDNSMALDGVSFDVFEGDVFGVIGESGSGKSTMARLILNLLPVDSGAIYLNGEILDFETTGTDIYNIVQIVFQNPISGLNPALNINSLLTEAIRANKGKDHTKESIERDIEYLLSTVRLHKDVLKKKPGQLSGGEGQRIALARALAVKPRLLVFDESISSLDREMQNDILSLLSKLKKELGLTYVFITHDLSVSRMFCNRLMVLHKGRVVEYGNVEDIFNRPKHDYTKRLLDSLLI